METTVPNSHKNAAFLTLLTLVRKILSILYKIPYQNVTGDMGFYVLQQIYPFIGINMLLTSFALPHVISKILIDHHYSADVKHKIKKSLALLSVVTFLLLFVGNYFIAHILSDVRLAPAIRILAFHFLFTGYISYFRGVLIANNKLKAFTYSTIMEQMTRILLIIAVLYLYGSQNLSPYRMAELTFGFTLAAPFFTIAHLLVLGPVDDIQSFLPHKGSLGLWKHTLFLFLSNGILIIFSLLDSFLLFNNLVPFHETYEAMELTGVYNRGLPLIQSGTFFVTTLVGLTISKMQRSKSEKQKNNAFSLGVLHVLGLAIPATVGIILVMPQLNMALFHDDSGVDTLQIIAIQILLYSFVVLFTTTLADEHKDGYVVAALLSGIAVKLMFTGSLVAHFGINGAAIANLLGMGLMTFILAVGNRHRLNFKVAVFVWTIFFATIVMVISHVLLTPLFEGLNDGSRLGYLALIIVKAFAGIAVYSMTLFAQVYLLKAIGKWVLKRHQNRRKRLEKAKRAQMRNAKVKAAEVPKKAKASMPEAHKKTTENSPKTPLKTQKAAVSHPEPPEKNKMKEGRHMRLDKFLKVSRIIKRRQTAKEVSDAGKIFVNGKVAKSSTSLTVGDEITLHYATRTLVVRVTEIKDSTKKEDADKMYEVVSETPRAASDEQ